MAVLLGKPSPAVGLAAPGRAGGQAGLRFLVASAGQVRTTGKQGRSRRPARTGAQGRESCIMSALEVAEGRGRPTGAEFLGKIR